MARAKAEGRPVGRPPISEEVQEQLRTLCEQDVSVNRIAKQLGIAYGTVWSYAKALEADANHET